MTKIEWTEQTWNPIVGCSIVSPGCTNCYAMGMASRLEAMRRPGVDCDGYALRGKHPLDHYAGTTKRVNGNPVWTGKVAMAPDHVLLAPLKRRKPTMHFVNSMGDPFHEDVPHEWIDRVFAVMALTPQHTYQVLTKRSARMLAYINGDGKAGAPRPYSPVKRVARAAARMVEDGDTTLDVVSTGPWPLPNVWLGVSAERQKEADERIPDLLNTPAAVRFVSAEPLLGPINFTRLQLVPDKPATSARGKKYARAGVHLNALRGRFCESGVNYVGDWDVNLPGPPVGATIKKLDWIIVGGESGRNARPMHPDWARAIRDQCAAADVPFFFKQWGEWAPSFGLTDVERAAVSVHDGGHFSIKAHEEARMFSMLDRSEMKRTGKARAGRLLDGIEHNTMPGTTSRDAPSGQRAAGVSEGAR